MRRLLGLTWVGLLLAAMALAAMPSAPVASAHAARLSADPPDNAVLTTGPERVSATFNERLQTTFVAMTVVGPDGNLWSAGDPTVQGAGRQHRHASARTGRHLHGELPSDLRRWPCSLRVLVVSAHGGRHRDARTRCRCHLSRQAASRHGRLWWWRWRSSVQAAYGRCGAGRESFRRVAPPRVLA